MSNNQGSLFVSFGGEWDMHLEISYPAVHAGSEEYQNLNNKIPPLKELSAFLGGFLFIGWGWWRIKFRWYGARDFILGIFSFIIGVMLWAYGIDGLLEWSTQF